MARTRRDEGAASAVCTCHRALARCARRARTVSDRHCGDRRRTTRICVNPPRHGRLSFSPSRHSASVRLSGSFARCRARISPGQSRSCSRSSLRRSSPCTSAWKASHSGSPSLFNCCRSSSPGLPSSSACLIVGGVYATASAHPSWAGVVVSPLAVILGTIPILSLNPSRPAVLDRDCSRSSRSPRSPPESRGCSRSGDDGMSSPCYSPSPPSSSVANSPPRRIICPVGHCCSLMRHSHC